MADLPARRFNETDTDAILRRTAELATGSEEKPARRGLSLDEMESLAREAGLDPALVRQAARDVTTRQAQQASPWAGAPRRIVLEEEFEGELTEELWESMVGELQRCFGGIGLASKVGRTRTWMFAPTGPRAPHTRAVSVTASTAKGKTVIRIDEQLSQLAGALFGGIVGGFGGGTTGIWMGIGMGVLHSPIAAVALMLTSIGGAYSLARHLFVSTYRKRTAELSDLLTRLGNARPIDE
ncbi:MAG TPA: hypothetical protein VG692_12875 [Gemmatimonadales bacterium]|nr:hypothetical protein [Gemmatimonadales bacterium]